MKSRFFLLGVSTPLLLLILFTIVSISTNLDLKVQSSFYSENNGWFGTQYSIFHFFTNIASYIELALVALSVIIFSLSLWNPKLQYWRKATILIILTFLISNVLIINFILKGHWGRPAPNEIINYGGEQVFTYLWQKQSNCDYNAFPCSHCSQTFLLAILYLFFRLRNMQIAKFVFFTGIFLTAAIGFSRMALGLQFFSDVIWGMAIVWYTALIISIAIRVGENNEEIAPKKKNKRIPAIIGITSPILVVLFLLATPYVSTKKIQKTLNELNGFGAKVLIVDLEEATLDLRKGDCFRVKSNVTGFGMPRSKVKDKMVWGDTAIYSLNTEGWFAQKMCNTDIEFPLDENKKYELKMSKGKVAFDLPTDTIMSKLSIFIDNGDVKLSVPKNAAYFLNYSAPHIENELSTQYKFNKNKVYTQGETGLQIDVTINNGTLFLCDL